MLSKELKDEVLEAIDRGNWKHSWYLELSRCGNIDFNSEKNLSKMIEVLECERDFGIEVAARASRLLPLLSAQLRRAVDTARPPLTEEALQILEQCFPYVRDK